jgi:hypothetical protein
MRLDLKMKLLERWHTQKRAAEELGLDEKRISRIIHCHEDPNRIEAAVFEKEFGPEAAAEMLRRE